VLLRFQYQPSPQPVNCATLTSTTFIAEDASNPFYIRTQRRLARFDPTKLHWRVQCPKEVSGKTLIRGWANRRVHNAFAACLQDRGWDRDGRLIEKDEAAQGGAERSKQGIGGALLMILTKDKLALTASKEEVKETAAWVLQRVMQLRRAADSHAPPTRKTEAIQAAQTLRREAKSAQKPRERTDAQPNSREAPVVDASPDEIRAQAEYYFSDQNLPFDRFLLSLTGGSENRPVSLRRIHSFKRMRRYQPFESVKEALKGSKLLVVTERDEVRRSVGLNPKFGIDPEANKALD